MQGRRAASFLVSFSRRMISQHSKHINKPALRSLAPPYSPLTVTKRLDKILVFTFQAPQPAQMDRVLSNLLLGYTYSLRDVT